MSMASHMSIRVALIVALTLAAGIGAEAQTNWPKAKTVSASRPSQVRGLTTARRRKVTKSRNAVPATTETELLRSMAALVTRQAEAIELLAKRLEAAEARLALVAPIESEAPTAAAIEDPQAPFRASLFGSIDWAALAHR
jgi:hypothetical protein